MSAVGDPALQLGRRRIRFVARSLQVRGLIGCILLSARQALKDCGRTEQSEPGPGWQPLAMATNKGQY